MKTSDLDECVLCCREINIYAVGTCDHPVCYECSARMRVLCETNECPICRSDMPIVICTIERQPFSLISRKYSLIDRKYQVVFQNVHIQKAFQLLLENKCKTCDETFPTFGKLKDHVRKAHALQYCELCSENLKIFPFERKVYNRKDLARHKRIGDPDETSHRGHPICEFCDQRYVDSDELFRHLRREHFFCHFCDADGKHQYYEDYEYLRVHFRSEHYLCEEGDCLHDKFVGAFRTEIDLKAHIAVYHSKSKSKAEARQARTLDFEFNYAPHNRPSANSSPRGNRYNRDRRQNVEENSARENKSQPPEVESIDTESTLEFPYLSEDGESKPVPKKNLNSVTLQSFNRNPAPPKQKNVMSSEDFPALVSAATGVTHEVSNNQNKKFNYTNHGQNNVLAKAPNLSSLLSQRNAQPKSNETNSQRKEADKKSKKNSWLPKKQNFEDDFPMLEKRQPPQTLTSSVSTPVVNNVQRKPTPIVEVVSSSQGPGGDQFIVIKSKVKKKKHKVNVDNKTSDDKEDSDEKDEASNSSLYSNNNFNLLEEDVEEDVEEDKFKKNLLRSVNVSKADYIEETWQQKVSFGKDDFPPLAPTQPVRKPPGFNGLKKKVPPPGFNVNSNESSVSQLPLNISLKSIAQQIAVPNKNNIDDIKIPHSDFKYKNPSNFNQRNTSLATKVTKLPAFNDFRTLSMQYRQNEITAANYYSECLNILDEGFFLDIFPELICLLPDINKQQELLHVHRKHQNSCGAVPKELLDSKVSVCDICYQVLMETDYQKHLIDHETE